MNVVNWWATWPAETVVGSVIREQPFYRPREPRPEAGLAYPDALWGDVARRVVEPSQR